MRTLQRLATPRGPITIVHDAGPADVDAAAISPGLCSIIRHPDIRRTVYRRLAADPAARLTLALAGGVIVGRAVVAPSFGRWRALPRVQEFGIEVAREWRRAGVAEGLTRTTLADPAVEDAILLAFTLPSARDPEHARLPLTEYGKLLVTGATRFGFRPTDTDEPEVRFQPSASLLVRIGTRAPAGAVAAFERARYRDGAGRYRARYTIRNCAVTACPPHLTSTVA